MKDILKTCFICNNEFKTRTNMKVCCSNSCSKIYRQEYLQKRGTSRQTLFTSANKKLKHFCVTNSSGTYYLRFRGDKPFINSYTKLNMSKYYKDKLLEMRSLIDEELENIEKWE